MTRRPADGVIFDISPELTQATAVFPGDTGFSSHRVSSMAEGGSCDVGTVTMSLHTGAHADAPSHFSRGGLTIDQVPLAAYLGPVRVVDLPVLGAIGAREIARIDLRDAQRVLLKTGSAPDPTVFERRAAYLTGLAATRLAGAGLRLVGIDTASMDRWDSKSLSAHKALLRGGVAILENLVLDGVPAGDYDLIALPLRLRGLDASPVRAILRSMPLKLPSRARDRGRGR